MPGSATLQGGPCPFCGGRLQRGSPRDTKAPCWDWTHPGTPHTAASLSASHQHGRQNTAAARTWHRFLLRVSPASCACDTRWSDHMSHAVETSMRCGVAHSATLLSHKALGAKFLCEVLGCVTASLQYCAATRCSGRYVPVKYCLLPAAKACILILCCESKVSSQQRPDEHDAKQSQSRLPMCNICCDLILHRKLDG